MVSSRKKVLTRLIACILMTVTIVVTIPGLSLHSQAAATKLKLKGMYWDHQTKTANKQSKVVKLGKTYKVTLAPDKRHPGSYNGMVRFVLPKYGKYHFTMTGLKNGSYVAHVLYKKYNYGIGYASYFSGEHYDLVSDEYYKSLQYTNSSSLDSCKVKKATSTAILESKYKHYMYFMSDSKVTFNFKITKAK